MKRVPLHIRMKTPFDEYKRYGLTRFMDSSHSSFLDFTFHRLGHKIYASVTNKNSRSCWQQMEVICTTNPSRLWLDLILEKGEESLSISCNGGNRVVFGNSGDGCRDKLNATFTSVTFFYNRENSMLYQKAPAYWKLAAVNSQLCHNLKNQLHFKIKTTGNPAWKTLDFYSNQNLKLSIKFYVSASEVSHAFIHKCHGSSTLKLKYCQVEKGAWVTLKLIKIGDEALNIYCQGRLSLELGANCAKHAGNDLTYFTVRELFEESFLCQVGGAEAGQGR